MNTFYDQIAQRIEKKTPVVFLSPHLDDAVLSCGELLRYLSDKTPVSVITLFSGAHTDRPTFSAHRFLMHCGVKSAAELFKMRRSEDVAVLKTINVTPLHLNWIDGTWRKYSSPSTLRKLIGSVIPEFLHLYPTFFHVSSGKLHSEDIAQITHLVKTLKAHIPENALVFAPLATGNHVDHVLTREIANELKADIYWSDFPYNMRSAADQSFIRNNRLHRDTFEVKNERKNALIRYYVSQLPSLFPDGNIFQEKECYYSV